MGKKFEALLTSNGERFYLGRYSTENEAAEVIGERDAELIVRSATPV